jgi:hypothetical protein
MWVRRNAGEAWARSVRAHTPNVVPPATPKSGTANSLASSLKTRSCSSVRPRPPYSAGYEMPA